MAGYIIYSLDWNKFRQLVEQPTENQLTVLAKLVRDGLEENDGEFDEDDPIAEWPTKTKDLVPIVAERLALPDWYSDLSTPGKSLWEGVIFNACMNSKKIDVDFRVDSDGVYWDVIELAWKQLGVVPHAASDVALSAFGTRPYRYHPRSGPGKTRAEFDQERDGQRASLEALGNLLGQFLEGAKKGQKDPNKLVDELEEAKGVSREHKDLIKDFLNDDDDEDDEDEDEDNEWTSMHSMHTPDEVVKMRAELHSVEAAIKAAKNQDALADYQDELMPALEAITSDGRMLFIQVDS